MRIYQPSICSWPLPLIAGSSRGQSAPGVCLSGTAHWTCCCGEVVADILVWILNCRPERGREEGREGGRGRERERERERERRGRGRERKREANLNKLTTVVELQGC